jgi:excisionase family DNA binding protein
MIGQEARSLKSDSFEKLAYSVPEAAELLSISRSQIYEMISTGKIGSISIGRSRRVTHRQLMSFLEKCESSNLHD